MLELIKATGGIINRLVALTTALALLAFFWGLAKFIFHLGGDEKAVDEGKRVMKWGLIALFIMISVWGIIIFMQRALGLPVSTSPGHADCVPPGCVSI